MSELKKVKCSSLCGFEDEFEPDEFGINYFQAVGTCPNCGSDTIYENGELTAIEVIFTLITKPDGK